MTPNWSTKQWRVGERVFIKEPTGLFVTAEVRSMVRLEGDALYYTTLTWGEGAAVVAQEELRRWQEEVFK